MLTIDGYGVDAEITGEPTYESEMTTFPMERDANMTDHVRNLPVGFSCEGIISESPIGRMVIERANATGKGITQAGNQYLIDVWRRKTPVTVTCALGTFDSMVLVSYSPKKRGGSIQFTARFMLATFVDNERTFVKVLVPRAQNTTKVKKGADPFEGPAMFRTIDYYTWVANGRTGPRAQERVGRIYNPKGDGTFLWTHADGKTPLSGDDAEMWRREQMDAYIEENPVPGYRPGKVPGKLEKIPYSPFDPNASVAAQERGAAYFSPTQEQWVTSEGTPVLGAPGQWGDQWERFGNDQSAHQRAQDAANTGDAEFVGGAIDEMEAMDTNGDGKYGPGDASWENDYEKLPEVDLDI